MWMEGPHNILESPNERDNSDLKKKQLWREWERRGSSVLSKLQIAWKTVPVYWHPWGLLKFVFSSMNISEKERGSILLQLYAATSSQKLCVDWSTSTAQSLLPDVPRQGDTRTVRHVLLTLQPWQGRAISMLSWEAGEKRNSFILPVTGPTILCYLIEDKSIFYSVDRRRM